MSEEIIIKPNREPDYIHNNNCYVWFNELIWLSVDNNLYHVFLCDSSSKLRFFCHNMHYVRGTYPPCTGPHFLPTRVQQAYGEWLIKVFEDTVLGASDGEN